MDLSGGFPSVIISALTYSEPGLVSLLPALPPTWDHGKIEGVLLRGRIKIISLSWEGKQINAILESTIPQIIRLKNDSNKFSRHSPRSSPGVCPRIEAVINCAL